MKIRRCVIVMIALLLYACSSPSSLPLTLPDTDAVTPVVTDHLQTTTKAPTFTNLYVDYGGRILIFKPGSTTPIRTIANGVVNSNAMAIDAKGYLYVANEQVNSVSVYAPKKGTVLRTLVRGIQQPRSIAIDKTGNIYIAGCSACSSSAASAGITIYGPGGTQFKRTITKGVTNPYTLALDPAGTLYVGNGFPAYDVTMYAPGSRAPKAAISSFSGVESPYKFAFDAVGDLFLGVIGIPSGDVVRIYPPNSTKSNAAIKTGIHFPASMIVDEQSGNLFVVNSNVGSSAHGSIAVYSLTTHKLVRSIVKGIANPSAIALDGTGRLYVANWGYNTASASVTVYSPGGSSPVETIPSAERANAFAFGP